MAWPQAVHAEAIDLQGRYHLVMQHRLELFAGIERVFVNLTQNTVWSRISGTRGTGNFRLTWKEVLHDMLFTSKWSLVAGDRCLGGLSTKVNEVEKFLIVRHINRVLAVPLPLEHRVNVKLELEYRSDEGSGWFIIHCLESSGMLLNGVVQAAELLAPSLSAGASRIMRTCI